jgi:hypothetical protein
MFYPRDKIVRAWQTPEGSSPKAFSVSSAFKSDPAWDEKGSGVGRREKRESAHKEKHINMAAPVLLKLFSAQMHNSSFRPSPRPGELPSL